MGLLKILIFIGVLGFAAHLWSENKERNISMEQVSEAGFVRTVMVDAADPDTVLILAPVNCPSEEAQQAAELAKQLTRMGIPNVLSSTFSVSIANPSDEEKAGMDRALAILQRGAPAVFINGMAKSKPSAEEVADEYNRESN